MYGYGIYVDECDLHVCICNRAHAYTIQATAGNFRITHKRIHTHDHTHVLWIRWKQSTCSVNSQIFTCMYIVKQNNVSILSGSLWCTHVLCLIQLQPSLRTLEAQTNNRSSLTFLGLDKPAAPAVWNINTDLHTRFHVHTQLQSTSAKHTCSSVLNQCCFISTVSTVVTASNRLPLQVTDPRPLEKTLWASWSKLISISPSRSSRRLLRDLRNSASMARVRGMRIPVWCATACM